MKSFKRKLPSWGQRRNAETLWRNGRDGGWSSVERILIPVRIPILRGGNEGSSYALAGISVRGVLLTTTLRESGTYAHTPCSRAENHEIGDKSKVTAVGFEPTPLRTGDWSQRLRPLGQTVAAQSNVLVWSLPRRPPVAPCQPTLALGKGTPVRG